MATEPDALATAFERAAGVCECIGGGCPALTHRPGVNRCFGTLRNPETTFFFTISRFADKSNSENLVALCTACAESPRKNAIRVLPVASPLTFVGDGQDEHA